MGGKQSSEENEHHSDLQNLRIISNFLDKDLGKLYKAEYGTQEARKVCYVKQKEIDSILSGRRLQEYCK